MPNILIWAWYFWKKDVEEGYYMKDPDYYRDQQFQKLIYRLNQPFLRIDQSAFTNISIFDRPYLESLFGGVEFPDGTFAIDHIEDFVDFQKHFMKVVSEIREVNMFTYPVLTYSLLRRPDITKEEIDEMVRTRNWNLFADQEFARWCSNHNIKWSDSNFFVSDNVGVLSNCPMSGDTPILYWNEYFKEFKVSPIKDIYYNTVKNEKSTIKVLSNGQVIECKINRFNESANYEITLVNGLKIRTTGSHLNKTFQNDAIRTDKLTIEYYLPVSLTPYEATKNMSYEDGRIIGMFLGDGSYRNDTEVTFSLNHETKQDSINFLYNYCPNRFGAKITEYNCQSEISGKLSCVNISVNSKYMRSLIEEFVDGDSALTKGISYKVLTKSMDFRRGILDGLYETDEGNSNRIYTSSSVLKDTLITMLASMGIAVTISEDNREGRLGTNTNYTIRYYTPNNKTQRKNVYIIRDGFMWFKIKSINRVHDTECSYCLEVLDETVEPIFMLANGIHTHNCRLLSDTKKIDVFINSIGGTALSVGSCRVSTINLMRIAYESKGNKKKYIEILKDKVDLDCKALSSMRHILKRNIEKGLLPNYQEGAVELDKQFCTIGKLKVA